MAKRHDLDALGAQYREAKGSIVVHRRAQAQAEVALARARRRHRDEDHPDVVEARQVVATRHADVGWCQAVMVAAGEAYKGEPLDEVLARNEAHRDLRDAHRLERHRRKASG